MPQSQNNYKLICGDAEVYRSADGRPARNFSICGSSGQADCNKMLATLQIANLVAKCEALRTFPVLYTSNDQILSDATIIVVSSWLGLFFNMVNMTR